MRRRNRRTRPRIVGRWAGDALRTIRPMEVGHVLAQLQLQVRVMCIRRRVDRSKIRQHRDEQLVLVGDDPAEVLAEPLGVEQVADADAVDTSHLVAITRTDPSAGRPKMIGGRGRLLGETLLGHVVGHDDVRPVADDQTAAEVDALGREGRDLLQEGRRMHDHAVADDARDPRAKDAGRDERELVRDAVRDDRMPGVRPTLIPHHHVVAIAKQVNDLPLRLVAPLEAHHASRCHGALAFASLVHRKALRRKETKVQRIGPGRQRGADSIQEDCKVELGHRKFVIRD